MKKKILIVVGTRPNFIKITQFKKIAKDSSLEFKIVHTGQHYDTKMSDVFFEQFRLTPDYFLNIAPASATTQIAMIMIELEKLIQTEFKPELLIAVGDVNSTLAAALVANKLSIKLAHLESGLRSFDRSMPEEHNRVLTDALSDYFFVTEKSGMENLLKEGKQREQLFFVGNTMIDSIVGYREQIEQSPILEQLDVQSGKYILMTMHRPATVDTLEGLNKLAELINLVTDRYKIVFPVHPRTKKNMETMGMLEQLTSNDKLLLTEPLDYFSFQKLIANAKLILTDSGGIQEESTFQQVPCLTFRPNTERPVTTEEGTNTLLPFDIELVSRYLIQVEKENYKAGRIPDKWDGKATSRIIEKIAEII